VHTIDQGWLPGERLLERVRRVRSTDGTRYFRTVKAGGGIRRVELEEETSEEMFRALWRLTRGRRSSKRRYRVEEDGVVWEIDRFPGGKLVLAEVELSSADTPVKPPDWLAPHIVREVTGEPAYLNVNLAS
jgi:CYTH domain-containing protein